MKNDITAHVCLAWELICRYDLNSEVKLSEGAAPVSRFILIDSRGNSKSSPSEATSIMDMVTGLTFLPQSDSNWFEQMVDRFRVSVKWIEETTSWEANASQRSDMPMIGYGKTPGVAVVEALVKASRSGHPPEKHEFRAS
jgi:hypothetical protein